MGAFTKPPGFRRIAELISWGIYTEYIINDLGLDHTGPYTEEEQEQIAGYLVATAYVFGADAVGSKIIQGIGWGTVSTVLAAFYIGKWASQAIDPEEGRENYYGFMTGGMYGNDPNYIAGTNTLNPQSVVAMQGGGGYFDVVGNFAAIINYEAPINLQASELEDTYWSPRAKTWVSSEAEADIVVKWMLDKGLTTSEEQFWIKNGVWPWEI